MEGNKDDMLKICDAKIAEFSKRAETAKQQAAMWATMKKEVEKELSK